MVVGPCDFVVLCDKYIGAAWTSFRGFLKSDIPPLPGEEPPLSDLNDHLSTAFPEVRFKSFLEMRGADGGPWNRICALPALWVGLLYDQGALDAAWDLVKGRSEEHTSELQSLMRISYAVFCLKKKKHPQPHTTTKKKSTT